MGLTAAAQQSLIIATIGDRDNVLRDNVPIIWEVYADFAVSAPRLQYLYTLRGAILVMQGKVRNDVNFSASGDLSVQLHQRFESLEKMLKSVDDEIEETRTQLLTASFRGSSGRLKWTQPSYPPYGSGRKMQKQLRGDVFNGEEGDPDANN